MQTSGIMEVKKIESLNVTSGTSFCLWAFWNNLKLLIWGSTLRTGNQESTVASQTGCWRAKSQHVAKISQGSAGWHNDTCRKLRAEGGERSAGTDGGFRSTKGRWLCWHSWRYSCSVFSVFLSSSHGWDCLIFVAGMFLLSQDLGCFTQVCALYGVRWQRQNKEGVQRDTMNEWLKKLSCQSWTRNTL